MLWSLDSRKTGSGNRQMAGQEASLTRRPSFPESCVNCNQYFARLPESRRQDRGGGKTLGWRATWASPVVCGGGIHSI